MLNNCSSFPFENIVKNLKSMVRKHEEPLQQVVRRYGEQFDHKQLNSNLSISSKPLLKYNHNIGPLTPNFTGQQFKQIFFNNIIIKVDVESDRFIMAYSKVIVKCINIVQNEHGEIAFIGYLFNKQLPFYDTPIYSSLFDIYIVRDLSKTLSYRILLNIQKKEMVIDFNALQVTIPIFHTSSIQ